MKSNRTFEEIVNLPELTDGTLINAKIGEMTFEGKIVGKSFSGLFDVYIVECMDGTLPNEFYGYKVVSLPISEIFVKPEESK